MTGPVPIFSQVRTQQHIYLLKQTEDQLLVRVYDHAMKCLCKTRHNVPDLNLPENITVQTKPKATLDHLIAKKVLGSEFPAPDCHAIEVKDCKEHIQAAIKSFLPLIVEKQEEVDCPDSLRCPISLEPFEKPMVDEHGHTLDESMLDQLFNGASAVDSPISRERIRRSNMKPNYALQAVIDERRESSQKIEANPVPNFSDFKEEDADLADLNLRLSRAYIAKQEYIEAESAFRKMVQYTKDPDSYMEVVGLYDKAELTEKATLARLYLADYLLDLNASEAIEPLKRAACESQGVIEIHEALIEVLLYLKKEEPILTALKDLGSPEGEDEQKKLVALCNRVIEHHPGCIDLYEHFSSCIKSTMAKDRLLLKGACEIAEAGNLEKAIEFCSKVGGDHPFMDHLVQINLMEQMGQSEAALKKLHELASYYKEKRPASETPREVQVHEIKARKQIAYREPSFDRFKDVVALYEPIGKGYKLLTWYTRYLFCLIEQEKWDAAERLALDLKKLSHDERSNVDPWIINEALKNIYEQNDHSNLEQIYKELGECYLEEELIEKAESIYKLALEKFKSTGVLFGLAEVYNEQSKKEEALSQYLEASKIAFDEPNYKCVGECVKKIKNLDAEISFLEAPERENLILRGRVADLENEKKQKDLQSETEAKIQKRKIERLERKVENGGNQSKGRWSDLVNWVGKAKLFSEERDERERIALTEFAFGADKWRQHLDDVGEEPPLPANMYEILSRHCPRTNHVNTGNTKKIGDTHDLTLIPQTIGGKFFSLNELEKVFDNPKNENSSANICLYTGELKDSAGIQVPTQPYWLLIYRQQEKNGSKATKLNISSKLKKFEREGKHIPSALEAATAILLGDMESGSHAISWTWCSNKRNGENTHLGHNQLKEEENPYISANLASSLSDNVAVGFSFIEDPYEGGVAYPSAIIQNPEQLAYIDPLADTESESD